MACIVARQMLCYELLRSSRAPLVGKVSHKNKARNTPNRNLFESGDCVKECKQILLQAVSLKQKQIIGTIKKSLDVVPHLQRSCVDLHNYKIIKRTFHCNTRKYAKDEGYSFPEDESDDITHNAFGEKLSTLPFLEGKPSVSGTDDKSKDMTSEEAGDDFDGTMSIIPVLQKENTDAYIKSAENASLLSEFSSVADQGFPCNFSGENMPPHLFLTQKSKVHVIESNNVTKTSGIFDEIMQIATEIECLIDQISKEQCEAPLQDVHYSNVTEYTEEMNDIINPNYNWFNTQQCETLDVSSLKKAYSNFTKNATEKTKDDFTNTAIYDQLNNQQYETLNKPHYKPYLTKNVATQAMPETEDYIHCGQCGNWHIKNKTLETKNEEDMNLTLHNDDSSPSTVHYNDGISTLTYYKPSLEIPYINFMPLSDQCSELIVYREKDKVNWSVNKIKMQSSSSIDHNKISKYIDIPPKRADKVQDLPQHHLTVLLNRPICYVPVSKYVGNVVNLNVGIESLPKNQLDEKIDNVFQLRRQIVQAQKYKEMNSRTAKIAVFFPPSRTNHPSPSPMPTLPDCSKPVKPKSQDLPQKRLVKDSPDL